MATMQYDVKSQHMNVSGLAVPFRTRLKGFFVGASTTASGQMYAYDTLSVPATYTRTTTVVTVTYQNHGLYVNQWVYLDFTSGGALDGLYQVTGVTANTFTITTAASGTITTSNVTAYLNVMMILDISNQTAVSLFIPGEGILARSGIYIVMPANITSTVFYG